MALVHPGMTREAARRMVAAAFRNAGLTEAELDGRVLTEAALGLDASALLLNPDIPLTKDEATRLDGYAARRISREPVARILGHREFWGLDFALSPATLVPRPDSETIVRAALDHARAAHSPDEPIRILDLGTGTGCLLLALLHEWPAAFGIGIDLAPEATRTARENARRLGLSDRAAFMVGRWSGALDARFDVVLSNPPYIPSADIAGLETEVRWHDPMLALDGAATGLAAYQAIATELPRLLAPDGIAVLELGIGQAEPVTALARTTGLELIEVRPDLNGISRAMVLKRG
jgi:release factor glutamine methyltransferase